MDIRRAGETTDNPTTPGRATFRKGLGRTLVLSFLALAVIPLTVVSFISYRTAVNSLRDHQEQALYAVATVKKDFIEFFFDRMMTDLKAQAEHSASVELLVELRRAFVDSGQPLDQFVRSPRWESIVRERGGDLTALRRIYSYDNVLLVDSEGNLLFSVARESDLGTNLIDGRYADTRFAQTTRAVLDRGSLSFSDFEHYAPSNGLPAGFLVAALTHGGEQVGTIGFQIPIDQLNTIMREGSSLGATVETYLVGPDLRMRSDAFLAVDSTLLGDPVDTEQTRLWLREHGPDPTEELDMEEALWTYADYRGVLVMGRHLGMNILGVPYGLIAEIDESEALAPANGLRRVTLVLGVLTVILVLTIAVVITRRLVGPITRLSVAASLVAAGDLDQRIEVTSGNEIGELGRGFNDMIAGLRDAATEREVRTGELTRANRQLVDLVNELERKNREVSQAKAALHQTVGRLEYSNNQLEEFAFVSAHHLQEPAREVVQACGMARRDMGGELPRAVEDDFGLIARSARRMRELVSGLHDLVDVGREMGDPGETSVDACVDRALESLAGRVTATRARIVRDELPDVVAHPVLIQRLYHDLIDNALTFVAPGTSPVIRLSAERSAAECVFAVGDDGIGIEDRYRGKIFAPFQRLQLQDEHSGAGIGLTVCRKIVDLYRGRIWVESQPNRGSVFYFTIPGDAIANKAHLGGLALAYPPPTRMGDPRPG